MPEEKKENLEERQIVIFSLGDEEFGVNISEVREIIRIEEITKIPNTESYVKGVINLRGGIIVVINLAMKLGIKSKDIDKNTRIIVIEIEDNTIGMVVDSATEVLRLSSDEIEPPPAIITKKINVSYIEGVGILGERLLILLDLSKVMGDDEIRQAQGLQESVTKSKPEKEKKEKEKVEREKKETKDKS